MLDRVFLVPRAGARFYSASARCFGRRGLWRFLGLDGFGPNRRECLRSDYLWTDLLSRLRMAQFWWIRSVTGRPSRRGRWSV